MAQLEALGLEPKTIARHQAAIYHALTKNQRPCFKVLDTGRLSNGAILPANIYDGKSGRTAAGEGFAAFVPAAGAASRYSQPLFRLVSALEALGIDSGTSDRVLMQSILELRTEGAANWPLPADVQRLLADPKSASFLDAPQRQKLLAGLEMPKALLPCVQEGLSFLVMKLREHRQITGLEGQVFVSRSGCTDAFLNNLDAAAKTDHRPLAVIEQGPALSTIRFKSDASPLLEADGRVSPVPAGHGALTELFPQAGELVPKAHSLFIRNIDNVMGNKPAALAATTRFLDIHRTILKAVVDIRAALARQDIGRAADTAHFLLAGIPRPELLDPRLAAIKDVSLQALWRVQLELFHANPTTALTDVALSSLYARPVNTLGQVPNTGRDVGGTPCFIDIGGVTEKICIEVPHVSEHDRRMFLADPARATHFNPGFVAAEIPSTADYYSSRNRDLWLLSEKTHRGQKALYYETVLYELLGNSRLANSTFVEVPRLVFHPHKTLKDAASVSIKDWLV